jgi:hypothetical protein
VADHRRRKAQRPREGDSQHRQRQQGMLDAAKPDPHHHQATGRGHRDRQDHVELRSLHLFAFENRNARQSDLTAGMPLGNFLVDLLEPRQRLPLARLFDRVSPGHYAKVAHRSAIAEEVDSLIAQRVRLRVGGHEVRPRSMEILRVGDEVVEARRQLGRVLEDL